MSKYIVTEVNFRPEDLEQLGTKEKFWFRFIAAESEKCMFKFSRADTGEHWSEKAAEQLAEFLGIPHANYQLAKCDQRYGVITQNLIEGESRLVMGNEVLHQLSPAEYPNPREELLRFVKVREHTVNRVLGCLDLSGVLPPKTKFDLANLTAGDVFCGYLMLDALISNRDRHHENWAIIVDTSSQQRILCPTYDHASSLGRELTDAARERRLRSRDAGFNISSYLSKAGSLFFKSRADDKPLSTLDAFYTGVERRERAKRLWLEKLASLEASHIELVFTRMPNDIMSEVAKEFSIAMVLENKRRLLEDERN